MVYFSEITTHEELKTTYRKLALLHHPDKGGSVNTMQKINSEYNVIRKKFKNRPKPLKDIKVDDVVFVNNTICVVTSITESSFLVKAKHKERTAWICKKTGLCKTEEKFKAVRSVLCWN